MRLFVSFDLPTTTNEDKKVYRDFRNGLLNEGFTMMQYSTYIRFCRNDTEKAKFVRHIKKIAPRDVGSIRMYWLTEKQYQSMFVFAGNKTNEELLIGKNPLIVFE